MPFGSLVSNGVWFYCSGLFWRSLIFIGFSLLLWLRSGRWAGLLTFHGSHTILGLLTLDGCNLQICTQPGQTLLFYLVARFDIRSQHQFGIQGIQCRARLSFIGFLPFCDSLT
jgi:hypothetical protein